MRAIVAIILLNLGLMGTASAWEANGPYPFGVINQRSLMLTAEYWNPILTYVGQTAGVRLQLAIAKTANETTDMAGRGELAFVYTNHLFTPERSRWGFKVLARQAGDGIQGGIVVASQAPLHRLEDLAGSSVVFANPYAFAGYSVPYDALLKAGVKVRRIFAGNQEAAMSQLKHGLVQAAGVNLQVMAGYAERENFSYRILYQSEPYYDLCIMAHPGVPETVQARVQTALIEMTQNPAGNAILAAAAAKVGTKTARGFVRADEHDYANYRKFYAQAEPVLEAE